VVASALKVGTGKTNLTELIGSLFLLIAGVTMARSRAEQEFVCAG
jgi:hypothetical protein